MRMIVEKSPVGMHQLIDHVSIRSRAEDGVFRGTGHSHNKTDEDDYGVGDDARRISHLLIRLADCTCYCTGNVNLARAETLPILAS
jgi:hypothetical protein